MPQAGREHREGRDRHPLPVVSGGEGGEAADPGDHAYYQQAVTGPTHDVDHGAAGMRPGRPDMVNGVMKRVAHRFFLS